MKFQELIQDERLLAALDKLQWEEPTAIQQTVIPLLADRQSVVMQAQTGSGKTGAYGLGILPHICWEENAVQCLVIAPTRELALQIKTDLEHLGKYQRIKCTALIGKQPMEQQIHDLKQKTHIVSGTCGRILDHFQQGTLGTNHINYIVIDEVDELCAMGFFEPLCAILDQISNPCCYCFCSATIDDNVIALAERYTSSYHVVDLAKGNHLSPQLKNEVYDLAERDKKQFLWKLLLHEADSTTIVFCNTRETCRKLYTMLHHYMEEIAIYHGGMEQQKREQELARLYSGAAQIMVSTDIAARGLDITRVDTIINYELPKEAVRLLHRAGRSARSKESGRMIFLLTKADTDSFQKLQQELQFDVISVNPQLIDQQPIDQAAITQLRRNQIQKAGKGAGFQQDIMRLYIHGGKNKKIRTKDIVGALCQIEGITFADIGVIEIQENGSYVEILHHKGSYVCAQLQERTIKNRKLKVEISHKQL